MGNITEIPLNSISGGGSSATQLTPWLGDGSDGSVTVSTVISLTRDMYYTDLHVTSAGTINAFGCVLHATGTITIDSGGQINCDGISPVSPGPGPANFPTGYGSGPTGGSAKSGQAGAGLAGTSYANQIGLGGAGGAGGSVGATAGGAAGAAPAGLNGSSGASALGQARSIFCMATGVLLGSTTTAPQLKAGAGGGSGAGVDGSHLGGGSAQGGPGLILNAHAVVNNGTLTARGGNGAASASVSNGGGGAGGGGGFIITNTEVAVSGAGAYNVSGGNGGAGAGTGTAGASGTSGTVINNVWS